MPGKRAHGFETYSKAMKRLLWINPDQPIQVKNRMRDSRSIGLKLFMVISLSSIPRL